MIAHDMRQVEQPTSQAGSERMTGSGGVPLVHIATPSPSVPVMFQIGFQQVNGGGHVQ